MLVLVGIDVGMLEGSIVIWYIIVQKTKFEEMFCIS